MFRASLPSYGGLSMRCPEVAASSAATVELDIPLEVGSSAMLGCYEELPRAAQRAARHVSCHWHGGSPVGALGGPERAAAHG